MSSRKQQRRIDYVPLDDIAPNDRNPKDHDLGQIDVSIGRFGYIEPITRDDRTGHIIGGHGRLTTLKAMRDRGDNPPDGIHVTQDGTWCAPVTTGWASRSDHEANAALIALNRSTELGGWADDALLGLLTDLAQQPDGLEGVGYDHDDIDSLNAYLNANPPEPEGMTDAEFEDMIDDTDDSGISLKIDGLTNAEVQAFRNLPGETDAHRLRGLMHNATR